MKYVISIFVITLITFFILRSSYIFDSGNPKIRKVPIGNGYAICEINSGIQLIEDANGKIYYFSDFELKGNYVFCVNFNMNDDVNKSHFMVDIKNSRIHYFKTIIDFKNYYIKVVGVGNLSFDELYNNYWSGFKWFISVNQIPVID